MEIVTGAIPSLLHKLGELLVGEYNLQKEVKGGIIFLQAELESMQAALEKISMTPADKIDDQDKIWARRVREMSYDIEDNIDKYIVQCKGRKTAEQHSFKEAIDRTLKWFRQPKIRRKIATEIREIKSRVIEVHERRRRYEVSLGVDKPVTVDPRLFAQYTEVKELVGIDEARDELISKIMIEENEVPKTQGKIVSIVGFGGLGKTTLANAVYKKIRAQFDCYAFVSVSQTPDLKKLYSSLLHDLSKNINDETLDERQLIEVLREFLEDKRYFIVVDDVWDISVWKMIRCALPDNDVGYTIITTTRISHVAEQAGCAYNMKPLSLNNSRKLLYRRIFGNGNKENNEEEKKCHDELAEVSDRILNKCAGVPLAIITMASLLACKARDKMEWYEVCNSIGTGLENNLDVENMRKILSFSYYELPCHLRACLLYLSMFSEDYEIKKDRLIKMWIGEGFIQCEKAGKSLFELGESYFNELINRSMIQPIHNSMHDMISSCCVHDMVLDLIRSLSSEENFVTVLSNMGGTSPSNTIRRLSLQNGLESHVMAQATWSLQHARSVFVFPASVSLVPPLDCCRVLRVLDLKDCNLSQANSSLKYLGNLHHLRYLGLCKTGISQLPEEIGNLQFLQTLDVKGNKISRLSSSVVQLRKLMYLYIDWSTRVPNGIGNLTCLEQLSCLHIDDSTRNIIEELGQLTELRQLSINLDEWNDKLLECLCKLKNMQELYIFVDVECNIGGFDAWVAPRHLRALNMEIICWFSILPAWINPSLLLDLTRLSIAMRELHQMDLEILGRLPALRFLSLEVDNKNLSIIRGFVVGAGAFACLRVEADLRCDGAGKEEVEQAKAALTHEAEMHPNHPLHSIDIRGVPAPYCCSLLLSFTLSSKLYLRLFLCLRWSTSS
ncbi:disease resistance protein RGA5 isoform X3 [Setaria viridis]|uniref:disease resistance protein RGA5 isoform X3 n=1 Tax=Setaria viridis TaxID=4556 RepID=UPI0014937EFF|nr:disease resistance protein RGA5-like isoform X3 [Setaria viridis]